MKHSKKTVQHKQSQSVQRASAGPDGVALAPNQTGMPDALKHGIESLSGISLDDVQVHYNSSKPAALDALAYTQGTDIHVGPGQEKHLAHEAWHVIQQAQGRVKPTMQMNGGVPVNDNQGLEHEADQMGAQALTGSVQLKASTTQFLNGAHNSGCKCPSCGTTSSTDAVQRKEDAASRSPIQMKKACLVCGHKHGASNCTTQVPDPANPGQTKACGCKSHSSKFDSGAKFNPGSGKRARRLAAMTS